MSIHPTLLVYPTDDATFRQRAWELAADHATDPARLEGELRVGYPDAVVRPRGLSGESDRIWYVYRDGRWLPQVGPS